MDEYPKHLVDLASAVSRLGSALIGRDPGAERASEMTGLLTALSDDLDLVRQLPKSELMGLHSRVRVWAETGQWPEPPPDGGRLHFDPYSFVGGSLNGFSTGAVYTRDGAEAVGVVTVPRNYEGPPDRVHGGMICCIFDEVMGTVFRASALPSAFTGEISVRFEAAAPLNTELEFRARHVRTDGRKLYLTGEGSGPDGQFATATATFIEIPPEMLQSQVGGS